ncbi:MAG: hypothetical protein H2060_03225 [Azoarcus sp.]|nr:hypothetical protein [Azoarcus sp.]
MSLSFDSRGEQMLMPVMRVATGRTHVEGTLPVGLGEMEGAARTSLT